MPVRRVFVFVDWHLATEHSSESWWHKCVRVLHFSVDLSLVKKLHDLIHRFLCKLLSSVYDVPGTFVLQKRCFLFQNPVIITESFRLSTERETLDVMLFDLSIHVLFVGTQVNALKASIFEVAIFEEVIMSCFFVSAVRIDHGTSIGIEGVNK